MPAFYAAGRRAANKQARASNLHDLRYALGALGSETPAKVFAPCFTTKPIGQGTGLGLSMIYGFARQSHGFVEMESAVGQGTAVRIHLPRSQDAEPDPTAPGFLRNEHRRLR